MNRIITFLLVLTLVACNGNKKISNDITKEEVKLISMNCKWMITEVDEIPNVINDNITITFKENKIGGQAHCNSYFSSFEEVNGLITIKPIGATRMACPKLSNEQQYFKKLGVIVKREVVYQQPNYILNLYDKENKIIIKAKKRP